MALQKCPECRYKISEHAKYCPRCGFSLIEADLELYRQALEKRQLHNQELNKQNIKIQLFWLFIFTIVIAGTIWLQS